MAYGDNSLNSMMGGGSDWTSLLASPSSTPQQGGGLLGNALNYGRDPYAKAAMSLLGGNGGMTAPTAAPQAAPLGAPAGSANALAGYSRPLQFRPTMGYNGNPYLTTPTMGAAAPPIPTGVTPSLPGLAANPTISSALQKLLNGGAQQAGSNPTTQSAGNSAYSPFGGYPSGFGGG